MRASIFAPARDESTDPIIERHVENATNSAIDAIESVVREAALLFVGVVA